MPVSGICYGSVHDIGAAPPYSGPESALYVDSQEVQENELNNHAQGSGYSLPNTTDSTDQNSAPNVLRRYIQRPETTKLGYAYCNTPGLSNHACVRSVSIPRKLTLR